MTADFRSPRVAPEGDALLWVGAAVPTDWLIPCLLLAGALSVRNTPETASAGPRLPLATAPEHG